MSQDPNFSQPMSQPIKPGPKPASGTSGKAIASLVLGLLSIIGMCLTGIPGLILGIMGLSDVGKSGGRLGGKGLAICGIVFSSIGILWTVVVLLIGMLLPAVSQVREAARRTASMNNMRQQSLAMLNYESAYMKFPLQDNNGLSWRVHILPFIEYGELHSRFNLDEPWDSATNKPLIAEMPAIFACPSVELAATPLMKISRSLKIAIQKYRSGRLSMVHPTPSWSLRSTQTRRLNGLNPQTGSTILPIRCATWEMFKREVSTFRSQTDARTLLHPVFHLRNSKRRSPAQAVIKFLACNTAFRPKV